LKQDILGEKDLIENIEIWEKIQILRRAVKCYLDFTMSN